MGMIFLSEYTSKKRTAHVFQRQEEKDFIAVCYNQGEESLSEPFADEQSAEDWAEDWVLNQTNADPANQQTAVTRGCCD